MGVKGDADLPPRGTHGEVDLRAHNQSIIWEEDYMLEIGGRGGRERA